MLLLPLLLAARALAQTTHTVTILDDNPDQRTLNTHTTTIAGDVFTTVTLKPDGVNENGQTRYALQTGVSAEHTVTSEMTIPPSTTPTTTRPGTATQSLPWQHGHHMEVVTVTDADGTVHNVTRVDQQSTHITVSASIKPDGTTVLVSQGSQPTPEDVVTTVVVTSIHTTPTVTAADVETTVSSTHTHHLPSIIPEMKVMRNRLLPECVDGQVSNNPVPTAAWPLYDRIIPQRGDFNESKPAACSKVPFHTYYSTHAWLPMQTATAFHSNDSNVTASMSTFDQIKFNVINNTLRFSADTDPKYKKQLKDGKLGNGGVMYYDQVSEKLARHKHCAVVYHVIDFGSCGGESVTSIFGADVHDHTFSSWFTVWNYLKKWWWILPVAILIAFIPLLCCLLPCLFLRRRRQRQGREKDPKGKEVVTVTEGSESSGSGGGSGSSEVVTSGGTTTSGGAAPTTATTGAPTEVVTTTTETGKDGPGTMRRAAEEGRAGQRVRFGENPGETTTTTTSQVDGTAELRTGSEVFDVGSMRGRKRNRGDEPL